MERFLVVVVEGVAWIFKSFLALGRAWAVNNMMRYSRVRFLHKNLGACGGIGCHAIRRGCLQKPK